MKLLTVPKRNRPSLRAVPTRLAWQILLPAAVLSAFAFPEHAAIVLVILLILNGRRYPNDGPQSVFSGAHGTARWGTRQAIKESGMLENRGGLFLGRLSARPPFFWRALCDLYTAPGERSHEVSARFRAALFGHLTGRLPASTATDSPTWS
jgi:hypothetical protein